MDQDHQAEIQISSIPAVPPKMSDEKSQPDKSDDEEKQNVNPSGDFKPAMSTADFREWGKFMVDYICDYLDTIGERRVIPDVEPGYLRPLMPEKAPEDPEEWPDILKDVEELIIPGLTHWQHPRFHAYFPAGNSFPSIMGDMLSDAFGTIGFSWAASPAMAELEIVVIDWLAELLGLPKMFMHEGTGGGALQNSASDCILISMLAARHQAIEKHNDYFEQVGELNPGTAILSRLVAYCSNLAHSSVEKAGLISFVQMRQLEVDDEFAMRADALETAIKEDINQGYIPFYVCATMGTTACCSFDNLKEIGPIAKKYGLWLHIDGAYGANSFICPEFRHHLEGVEMASSFNFNPNKWLLTNFDTSVFWVADKVALTHSMVVNPVYLQHKYSSKAIDFRHWGIPLSRRFRSLKLWFVIRKYGASGLRAYIRQHVRLAKLFASLVESDERFEVVGRVELGLVCFRIRGANALTQCLIRTINESRELHMVPAMVNDLYIIRFAVCRESASEEDIRFAWDVTKAFAEQIITAEASLRQWRVHTRENSIRKKRRARAAATALCLNENAVPEPTNALDGVQELDEEAVESDEEEDSSSASELGDLDETGLGDEDIIQLATERLLDLKEQGAREVYDLLAQQLRNLGVSEVTPYDDCDPCMAKETVTAATIPTPEVVASPAASTSPEEEQSSLQSPTQETLSPLQTKDDLAAEEVDDQFDPNGPRMGRFKSVSIGIAMKGMARYEKDRRVSQPVVSTTRFSISDKVETPKPHTIYSKCETPESSFLNGTLDNNYDHNAVSSTPFAPRQSVGGEANAHVPMNAQMRRFSLNPFGGTQENSLTGGAIGTAGSGGTPVVARLVSMVMNASGNGSMNSSYSRQPRHSLKSTTAASFDESREFPIAHRSTGLPSKKLNHTASQSWRVGMNAEDDVDDVFLYDHDLCVGGLSKESTLTRLRRQTLLKMISDPVSYKNRRNFRSLRDQRRMTAVSHEFEPQERPKSDYIRRPTVQICENIGNHMDTGSNYEDLMKDFKRRNKSMFESSSSNRIHAGADDLSSSSSIMQSSSDKLSSTLKRSLLNQSKTNEDKIMEEVESEHDT